MIEKEREQSDRLEQLLQQSHAEIEVLKKSNKDIQAVNNQLIHTMNSNTDKYIGVLQAMNLTSRNKNRTIKNGIGALVTAIEKFDACCEPHDFTETSTTIGGDGGANLSISATGKVATFLNGIGLTAGVGTSGNLNFQETTVKRTYEK